MTEYREAVRGLTRPATEQEKRVEMMAMFLCDSGLVPLPGGKEERRSGGHGWHRADPGERDRYRELAEAALDAIPESL